MTAPRHRWVILLSLGYSAVACSDGSATVSPTTPTAAPAPAVEFIRGWVRDTAIRPLSGARVELLTGPQAGLVATTDSIGEFSFTGSVDDGSRLRASKEGYTSGDVALGPTCSSCPGRPGRAVSFFLHVPDPPAAIAGNYTLTFTADIGCTALPEKLRSRTYEVAIAPSAFILGSTPEMTTSFQVTPRGGPFSGRIRFFWVNVAGDFVALRFGDSSDPAIIESVVPEGHVAFAGSAAVSAVDSLRSIVTPFTGTIEYCVNPEIGEEGYRCNAPATSRARCESESHQLVLTRR
jgi:hypothetical protein